MQKKEQEKEQTLVMDFIKILFVMYFITCILLLLLAFVLYKAQPGEMVSKVWLIAVYIISGLAGGFLIGKRTKSRKFLWGCLMGMLYFAILFAVSLLLYKGLGGDCPYKKTLPAFCKHALVLHPDINFCPDGVLGTWQSFLFYIRSIDSS